MKQERRIIVFCPDRDERQQIVWSVENLIERHFAKYNPIIIQQFESIYQAKGKLTIGASGDGLYIIDRHSPNIKPINRNSSLTEHLTEREIKRLSAVFNASNSGVAYLEAMNLIEELHKPYLIYKDYFALVKDGRKVIGDYKEKLRKEFEGELEKKVPEITRIFQQ